MLQAHDKTIIAKSGDKVTNCTTKTKLNFVLT